jgi:hypothetical protein
MKVVALAAVAAAFACPALAADLSPPPAGDPIYAPAPMALVGHLELGVGIGKIDNYDEGFGLFEGAGRVNIPLRNDWNIQVDVNTAATFWSGGDSYSIGGPAAHVWHRGPAGAVGVFGGVVFGGGTLGYGGVEATFDPTSNTTLGAQASFGAGQGGYNYWAICGWANYYFTPDTKLRGDVAYMDDNQDDSGWSASARLEHRFTGTAISAFGQVGFASASSSGNTATSWNGLVGVRLFLDPAGTTLQAHDHMVPWDVAAAPAMVRSR